MIGYIGQNREHSRLYPSSAIGQEDGQSEVIIRKVEKSTVTGGSEDVIRDMRREGKSWSEVCDWITRQVGYDVEVVEWVRKIYNDEAAKSRLC